jgi:2-polyprenyl-3-methyl-5-hydroxy-6-metoxy-1,4-benzoquinol methylase
MAVGLKAEPKKFFMSARDIAFWIRSARTDATFERLRSRWGSQKAFDLLYAEKCDPFGSQQSRWRYQGLKYERLISFLPKQTYHNVLDVGCGLGPFTRRLAAYADQVLGVDFSGAAIEQARNLSTSQPNVRYERGDIHDLRQITERFDLIAILDVLYYLSPSSDEVLKSIASQMQGLLVPGGLLLLVNHFFFDIDRQSKETRRIHDSFSQGAGLQIVSEYRRPFFLASLFTSAHPGG